MIYCTIEIIIFAAPIPALLNKTTKNTFLILNVMHFKSEWLVDLIAVLSVPLWEASCVDSCKWGVVFASLQHYHVVQDFSFVVTKTWFKKMVAAKMCRLKNKFINLLVTWICSLTVKEGGIMLLQIKFYIPFLLSVLKTTTQIFKLIKL